MFEIYLKLIEFNSKLTSVLNVNKKKGMCHQF